MVLLVGVSTRGHSYGASTKLESEKEACRRGDNLVSNYAGDGWYDRES